MGQSLAIKSAAKKLRNPVDKCVKIKAIRMIIFSYLGGACNKWIQIYLESESLPPDREKEESLTSEVGCYGDMQIMTWLMSISSFVNKRNFEVIWVCNVQRHNYQACKFIFKQWKSMITISLWNSALCHFSTPYILDDNYLVKRKIKPNLEMIIWCVENGARSFWEAFCISCDKNPYSVQLEYIHIMYSENKNHVTKFLYEQILNYGIIESYNYFK